MEKGKDGGGNSGEMSKACQLTIEKMRSEIKDDMLDNIKTLQEEMYKMANDIEHLKSKKADESDIQEFSRELSAIKEQIKAMSNSDKENKTAIDKLGDQLTDLFKLINEYNYENGEVIAKVENFSEQQCKFQETMIEAIGDINKKVESNKPKTMLEQMSDFWNMGKMQKFFIVFFVSFVVIIFLSAMLFYIGGGEPATDLISSIIDRLLGFVFPLSGGGFKWILT